MTKKRILGLDGLRAIAVVLVFVEHFVIKGQDIGHLGVRIFFVLSGFLIIGILHNQRLSIEAGLTHFKAELIKFWDRRSRRIMPLYYGTLTLILFYFVISRTYINTDGLLWYYLFMGNWYIMFKAHYYGMFAHLWSISVEQHFYMLSSPLLLLFASKAHKKVLYTLIGIGFMVFLANQLFNVTGRNSYLSSFINFTFMAAGGLVAISKLPNTYNKFLGAIAVVGCVTYLVLSTYKTAPLAGLFYYPFITFFSCYIGCVALIKYISSEQDSVFVRVLEWAPIRGLGTISYGFYVYHYFVPTIPAFITSPVLINLWPLFQFTLTVVVSWISWNFFEKRLLQPRLKSKIALS